MEEAARLSRQEFLLERVLPSPAAVDAVSLIRKRQPLVVNSHHAPIQGKGTGARTITLNRRKIP
jgi:hypothetical protein